MMAIMFIFFFSSRRRHTRCGRDWSSDVCSSDLEKLETERKIQEANERERKQAEELRTKVESILDVVNAASRGDLTRDVPVKGSDAVGQMGEGLGKFFTNLRSNVGNISQTA